MIEHGADQRPDHDGCTPLNAAACGGFLDIIQILIDLGADHRPDSFGLTPLCTAVSKGHIEVVIYLLGKGPMFSLGLRHLCK